MERRAKATSQVNETRVFIGLSISWAPSMQEGAFFCYYEYLVLIKCLLSFGQGRPYQLE